MTENVSQLPATEFEKDKQIVTFLRMSVFSLSVCFLQSKQEEQQEVLETFQGLTVHDNGTSIKIYKPTKHISSSFCTAFYILELKVALRVVRGR